MCDIGWDKHVASLTHKTHPNVISRGRRLPVNSNCSVQQNTTQSTVHLDHIQRRTIIQLTQVNFDTNLPCNNYPTCVGVFLLDPGATYRRLSPCIKPALGWFNKQLHIWQVKMLSYDTAKSVLPTCHTAGSGPAVQKTS